MSLVALWELCRVGEDNTEVIIVMSSGRSRLETTNSTSALQSGHADFARHGHVTGRKATMKNAIELHHGKCNIQYFWSVTFDHSFHTSLPGPQILCEIYEIYRTSL